MTMKKSRDVFYKLCAVLLGMLSLAVFTSKAESRTALMLGDTRQEKIDTNAVIEAVKKLRNYIVNSDVEFKLGP